MKKFKHFGVAILLAVTACTTSANNPVMWKADGHVANSAGIQKQLEITGIYDSLNYQGVTYLVGFKIDKDGTNHPQLVGADTSLSDIRYWEFEKIPNDIFVYQKTVHIVDADGGIYRLEKEVWQLTPETFPPDSQVVYSDNNADLIVCYPVSLFKNVVRASGCKSLGNNWQLDFVWTTQPPKVCAGELYALEEKAGGYLLNKVNIKTGVITSSKTIVKAPDELCIL
jgi:hypothetical protein